MPYSQIRAQKVYDQESYPFWE